MPTFKFGDGLLQEGRFPEDRRDEITYFEAVHDGLSVSLDLKTGTFTIGGETQVFPTPPSPRVIYYMTFQGSATPEPDRLVAWVIGWQATITLDGQKRNVRLGVKVCVEAQTDKRGIAHPAQSWYISDDPEDI